MFGKCNHKWLPVDMFGYQHCSKCGKSAVIGKPCQHKWKYYDGVSVKNFGREVGRVYILKCEICGELINHSVGNW